jgi:tetrahydromethanopterin S-methyltransferase subunit G
MLSEVLNRISGLDEKLVRLDDIDKKLSKLDTVSADLSKLSTTVDGLSREVNSFNKRLDDVEESSKFVGAKFDQINKETVTIKSNKKKNDID